MSLPTRDNDDGDERAFVSELETVSIVCGRRVHLLKVSVCDGRLSGPFNRTSPTLMLYYCGLDAGSISFINVTTQLRNSVTFTTIIFIHSCRREKIWAMNTCKIRVSDSLEIGYEAIVRVNGVVWTEWRRGLYNPHTMDGDILVNRVWTSEFRGINAYFQEMNVYGCPTQHFMFLAI